MNNSLIITSFTLAAMAGMCFISGVAILKGGKTYGRF